MHAMRQEAASYVYLYLYCLTRHVYVRDRRLSEAHMTVVRMSSAYCNFCKYNLVD
jgi:hypothetical protein